MTLHFLLVAFGVALLVSGAWSLVTGGSRLAAVWGIPPVIVGLTVVAFGTSAPELFVSLAGALRGSTGLVLGNVIGSNVANIGLILGCSAVLRPVKVEPGLIRKEVPLLVGITVLFALLGMDHEISRLDAGVLVLGFVGFIWWTLQGAGERTLVIDMPEDLPVPPPAARGRVMALSLGQVLLGIGGLAGGGCVLVGSSLVIARNFGVSETLIGLTLVAVGTSLPELATTLVAAWRKQDDLAVGNIVGSNLFNLLAVAGPVGLLKPLAAEADGFRLQLGSMVLLTVILFALVWRCGGQVGRRRGAILLILYGGIMTIWIIL